MLWALALLGILPAAFVFGDGEIDETSGTDSDSSEVSDGTVSASGDLSSDLLTLADDADADPASSDVELDELYDIVADGSDTTFENFIPGEDEITLHLTDDGSGDFFVETLEDADGEHIGMSLSYSDGDTETSLHFVGLDEIPAENISIGVTSQETGEEALYVLEDIGDFGAIAPNDPDVPAVANPDNGMGEPAITPNDPEAPAEPSGQFDPDEVVLAPDLPAEDEGSQVIMHTLAAGGDTLVLNDAPIQGGFDASIVSSGDTFTIETDYALHNVTGSDQSDAIALGDDAAIVDAGLGDDTIYAGEGTAIVSGGAGDDMIFGGDDTGSEYILDGGLGDDTLSGGDASETLIGGLGVDTISGGAGDDTIIFDTLDTAEGGSGQDTFWLYDDGVADESFAQITDFDASEDVLRVSLPSAIELSSDFDLDVFQTDDGISSQIAINGDVIAVVYGVPNVVAGDVVVDFHA